jgi:predicted ester cyclase
MMQLDFREFSFHALRWISLWTMRQTPPGGIMYVVANPLEKNAGWPGEEEAAVSSEVEENKAIVRRFLEATARGDLAAMDEMIAPDFVDRSLMSGQEPDREGFKRSVAEMDAPFTNQCVTIEDQIAEGDKVLTRVTYRATHDQGELLGIAPTGEEWALTAMYVHRIEGGKIAEEWTEASIDPWLQRLEEENRERERVEQEMRVARTIQQANLPKEMPTPEGWQLGLICQPAREVGGDFYDFHYLSDGRLGLVVGDATGKGVPAA